MSAEISLSVVIPALALDHANHTSRIQMANLPCVKEVIIVTPEVPVPQQPPGFQHEKIRFLRAPLGRASQMNAGAVAAQGNYLLFLHGDTEVTTSALVALAEAIAAAPDKVFAFTHRFATPRRTLHMLSRLGRLRDRFFPFPLGDQGLAVERRLFLGLGGYPDEPICEDVIMTWRLSRHTRWNILPQPAVTPADRFERRGICRTVCENTLLLFLFILGISPQMLVRIYYGDGYLERWRSARSSRGSTMTSGRFLRWIGFSLSVVWLGSGIGFATAADHSHALLDSVLVQHVHAGLVDYAGLQMEAHDPASDFNTYLVQLANGTATHEASWNMEQRLAYWINAYNVFTLKLIVDNYPISPRWYMNVLPFLSHWMPRNSILQIPGRWDRITFATVRGRLTLDEIEHQILRPEFTDPRVHFAIVCASVGCPRLRSYAFHPATINPELDAATTEFMAASDKVSWDPAKNSLRISKIFNWFRDDFSVSTPAGRPQIPSVIAARYGEDAGVISWLVAYGPDELVTWLQEGPHHVSHLPYDWNLNEQRSLRANAQSEQAAGVLPESGRTAR